MISSTAARQSITNERLSATMEEIADLLEAQGANPFRVRAYRRAAVTVRGLKGPVHQILRAEGIGGLMQLPGIGRSLAHAIEHLSRSGRLPLLERLRGEDAAEKVFATVPDIGPGLARRIHERLGIETLTELEAAASDGRLAQVPGMGRKRIRAVRESLAGRFARWRRQERFLDPQQSTERGNEVLASSHWNWEREEFIEGHGIRSIGKKNVLNNYCIGVSSNLQACDKCHAGYGFVDTKFDFHDPTNIDCLVCHDNSGTYVGASTRSSA